MDNLFDKIKFILKFVCVFIIIKSNGASYLRNLLYNLSYNIFDFPSLGRKCEQKLLSESFNRLFSILDYILF